MNAEQYRAVIAKTDPDATFMRLKEDAMNNGQTKPARSTPGGIEIDNGRTGACKYPLFGMRLVIHNLLPEIGSRKHLHLSTFHFLPPRR